MVRGISLREKEHLCTEVLGKEELGLQTTCGHLTM